VDGSLANLFAILGHLTALAIVGARNAITKKLRSVASAIRPDTGSRVALRSAEA